jgi:hypothetical protein
MQKDNRHVLLNVRTETSNCADGKIDCKMQNDPEKLFVRVSFTISMMFH